MKTLRKFKHVNAKTIAEVVALLQQGNAVINAGGTDLLGTLRFEILPSYPEVLINIKTIPGLEYIREENGWLCIGALTRLHDIAADARIKERYTALAQAAGKVGSPHIREMGTIAGNLCQLTRCWYFRKEDNRFFCLRKGGKTCFAMAGDNRYHSIFGAVKACLAVNPSDTAPALVALDARIKTTKRLIEAEKFWDVTVPGSTVLEPDEIVIEVRIPVPGAGAKSGFTKFALRKSIDFPIVNCAAFVGAGKARICLNAVYNKPYRAYKAEEVIAGRNIDAGVADAAGAAAVADARSLPGGKNKWKIPIAKAMVKRAILACA